MLKWARFMALSGIAAENLESVSGIAPRTIASTRQLEGVVSSAAASDAKAVLVADPQQLQSIETGAAFGSIHEHHGWAEVREVRREQEGWQRDPAADLATWQPAEPSMQSIPVAA
ncbi:AAA family ATPase [Azospirillum rugosum]|uniref:ATP-dependent exoDNAse (Exonuclease V) alpha subunit n=1 Tax=Azospirillum rugosum TaxID=416170 RepID=A0ABS4SX60_9PROT|nr:AAA family ATPase [Azospirillum rugosum]MBP2297149.1 ATP-dependent exoDNAse (exonuclease V) alpha subunit [Azospirillum rugosum]MDQ0530945.1 ATP-dependent exoDNAse (exonuclease V) alpha subunit [Azospirillum rugosum]